MEMIPYLDLKKINAPYRDKIDKSIREVLDSGWYIKGDKVEEFERELANYCQTNFAIGVANGLDALRIILMSYMEMNRLNKGDEILVPANTFIATMLAVSSLGLVPILVEPNESTFNLDETLLKNHISKKTKAILLVHLYGKVCFSEKIKLFAKNYNLLLVEDNAQALGAKWNGKKTGSLTPAGALSFYPGKNLGAMGDGGAITTNDKELGTICQAIANYGSTQKYVHKYKGLNSRLDEIQAAILLVKLSYLDHVNQHRRMIAIQYRNKIKNPKLILPTTDKEEEHVWHIFALRAKSRNQLQKHCLKNGIQTSIHYPTPPHKQIAYKQWNTQTFPITETIHNEELSIPLNESLTKDEINRIINTLNSY